MLKLRSLITVAALRSRGTMMKVSTPMVTSIRRTHMDEPTQPFDNMPFRVTNRFILTLVFAFLYGAGLWAPFLIVWYSMAKRTM